MRVVSIRDVGLSSSEYHFTRMILTILASICKVRTPEHIFLKDKHLCFDLCPLYLYIKAELIPIQSKFRAATFASNQRSVNASTPFGTYKQDQVRNISRDYYRSNHPFLYWTHQPDS